MTTPRGPTPPAARPCGCPEYLTVADVCALLHVNHHKVEDWIYRPCDPMPFRCFPGSQRGSYIHRDDVEPLGAVDSLELGDVDVSPLGLESAHEPERLARGGVVLGDVPVPAADAAEQVEVDRRVLDLLLRAQRGDSLGDFLGDELLHVRLSVSGPWALGGLAPAAKPTLATRALGFAYLAKRAAGEEGQGEMTEPPPIGALRRFARGSVALTHRAGGAPRHRREVIGAVRRAVVLGFGWGALCAGRCGYAQVR